MHEMEAHGLAMAANLARLQGRVDDACRLAAAAESLALTEPPSLALVQVAAFSADRGRGDPAEEPEVDERHRRPRHTHVRLHDRRGAHPGGPGRGDPPGDGRHRPPARGRARSKASSAGFGRALSLIVLGRHAEARHDAEWAISAATALDAPLAETAGRALLAEVTLVVDGDRDAAARLLDEAPPVTGGLAHLLVLRGPRPAGRRGGRPAPCMKRDRGAADARFGPRRTPRVHDGSDEIAGSGRKPRALRRTLF